MIDMFLVDDDVLVVSFIEYVVNFYNEKNDSKINLVAGTDGYEAIDLLNLRRDPFGLYLVDMRIPGELDSSERLYNIVKDKFNDVSNFYFITGHLSEHDYDLVSRTNANYILKPIELKRLFSLFDKIDYSKH